MALWVAGLGLLIAVAALAHARRLSRRLDVLSQSYWELRYDYTRLRSQVSRMDPADGVDAAEPPAAAAASMSFIPLSSMKKTKT